MNRWFYYLRQWYLNAWHFHPFFASSTVIMWCKIGPPPRISSVHTDLASPRTTTLGTEYRLVPSYKNWQIHSQVLSVHHTCLKKKNTAHVFSYKLSHADWFSDLCTSTYTVMLPSHDMKFMLCLTNLIVKTFFYQDNTPLYTHNMPVFFL